MADRKPERRDIYAEITNQVVALIEAGNRKPWVRPWSEDAAAPMSPVNAATGRPYRGINTLSLGLNPLSWGGDNRWATFKQCAAKDWLVMKGAKASLVVYFEQKMLKDREGRLDANGDPKLVAVPMLKYSNAFHASQIDGIPAFVPPDRSQCAWIADDSVESIMRNSGIPFITSGRAAYSPSMDTIIMPPRESFSGQRFWNATVLHELGHSTGFGGKEAEALGKPPRLSRDMSSKFGTRGYSAEELTAELSALFTSSVLGLEHVDLEGHVDYLASWLDLLKSDKTALFRCASEAQKASDFILLNWCPEYRLSQEMTAAAEMRVGDGAGAEVDVGPEPEEHAAAAGKDYRHYVPGGALVTIKVPFVPGDRVTDDCGHAGVVTSIMRQGESVEVQWDGGRTDILPAKCLSEEDEAGPETPDMATAERVARLDAAATLPATSAAKPSPMQMSLFG